MAYLQFNDPDPLYWVGVYLAVAVVAQLKVFGVLTRLVFHLAFGLVLAGLLMSAAGFIDYLRSGDYGALTGEMLTHKPYVESAREFLGLLIACASLAIYRPDRDSRTGS